MNTVPYSLFQKNMQHYLRKVNEDDVALLITNRDSRNDAVLMSKSAYDSMTETLRILSNPDLMKKIRRGRAQMTAHDSTHA